MIYLASPYTHEDPAVMQKRFEQVQTFTIYMIHKGAIVFSPIVYCHEMAVKAELPKDAIFWQKQNADMLRRSDYFMVLKLPGWDTSRGVQWELSMAEALFLPIEMIEVEIESN